MQATVWIQDNEDILAITDDLTLDDNVPRQQCGVKG